MAASAFPSIFSVSIRPISKLVYHFNTRVTIDNYIRRLSIDNWITKATATELYASFVQIAPYHYISCEPTWSTQRTASSYSQLLSTDSTWPPSHLTLSSNHCLGLLDSLTLIFLKTFFHRLDV